MAQIIPTEKKEGEVFSLCGKKNEEEMLEQQHPLLVNHDEFQTEPMENPKYQNASENEKNSKYKSECEEEKKKGFLENPKQPSESDDEEKTEYSSESEGEKKKCSLNRNLLLREGILERNESEQEGCGLFSPIGKKNEEEPNEQQIPTVNATVVVEPHLSDGKRKQELKAENDYYPTSSDGEESGEKEERIREIGSSIKGNMKRRKVKNTNKE